QDPAALTAASRSIYIDVRRNSHVRSSMTTTVQAPVSARLSNLDRWLPLWIGLAMVGGLLLGRFVPALGDLLGALEVGGISLPIAMGLLVMMYPVLAKVRYDRMAAVTGD